MAESPRLIPTLEDPHDGLMKKCDSLTLRQQTIRQDRFLRQFRKGEFVTQSATAAGVARSIVQHWRDTSPTFARRFEEAETVGRQNRENFVLRHISEMAREGDREIQEMIREKYGASALKKALNGQNLTLKDI